MRQPDLDTRMWANGWGESSSAWWHIDFISAPLRRLGMIPDRPFGMRLACAIRRDGRIMPDHRVLAMRDRDPLIRYLWILR